MKTSKAMDLDIAFKKLIDIWYLLPRTYREKYAVAKSKYNNPEIGIGIGMKIQMLKEAGFVVAWYYNPEISEKGSVL